MMAPRIGCLLVLGALLASPPATSAPKSGVTSPIPKIVHKDGRYALFVDGAPYFILGVQVNNSSAWPAMLPKVWPAVEYAHANTVEMPVYWEQFEPKQGHYDYTVMDSLLAGARAHHVRLVLLWFGTWKNGSSHYMPMWAKLQPDRYPRMINADGRRVDSPSPNFPATLAADKSAFVAFMTHLKAVDPQHTVIMVQVENETGTWGGTVRDHSAAAQKLFDGPVPSVLLKVFHKEAGTWTEVFGADADEYFHAYSIAHFVGQLAAAGKAVYPLPMYVNAALRDPISPGPASTYEAGGPTDNVIPIWKAAAPAIDIESPDIYQNDSVKYQKVLELYHRADNPLFVPETGGGANGVRNVFAVIGHQGIGFSPFGIDYTSPRRDPSDAAALKAWLGPLASNYELLGPMQRDVARWSFDGRVQAVAEQPGTPSETMLFDAWAATVSFGAPGFGNRNGPTQGNTEPIGRALIAQLGPDQFMVTGFNCRVDFKPADPASTKQRQFLRVEEGVYTSGKADGAGVFTPIRIYNGDQTDWGLNFASMPMVLRVTMGTY